jgi:hypothetical protein
MIHCYICYSMLIDDSFTCDTCDQYYCEDCSYHFTLHYQFQGARCYMCADQYRLTPLKEDKIKNMIKYWKAIHS